ncbi:hypothetical protein CsatB_030260 [Cannabis sativa]|uniref:Epidermal patterning factor-like protein n=1 Tax=Cannabis sativa TaxID=3483 RepID=A0A803R773_CANSA|nr:EPIDERMAL PATTERNING FACTOR-like protein 5 [Cannabis sativa]
MEWKRYRIIIIRFSIISTKPSLLFYYVPIFIFTISALFYNSNSFKTTCPGGRCSMSAKADHTYFQALEKMVTPSPSPSPLMVPRYLSGIGSSPPRCLWKCGNCTPCKPVHVPVPPGTPVTAEYYPEAWRCKCGNKLYMP